MITAQNLTKRFGKKTVVNDISFEVETGKVTGFLGPNGAGKSTTMRLMLGLDKGAGHTTFDGKPLYEYTQPSAVVGILLDAKAFHPTRSARSHLRALAALGNIPRARVDEVLDIVGLRAVAKKAPGKFSLGMSQRLGIAAALLGKPKYLMLDEPANGLDPEGIKWLRDFLKEYADAGNAVFVSSHLLSEISQMADNVVVIGKGKLIANTSISELVTGGAHHSTFVRATNIQALTAAVKAAAQPYEKRDNGLLIPGTRSDEIGHLLAGKGLTILELSNRTASLEEVFFELTAGSEEYAAHPQKGSK